jgi:hypothetical protein
MGWFHSKIYVYVTMWTIHAHQKKVTGNFNSIFILFF